MENNVLLDNEYIKLTLLIGEVYIETYKIGCSIKQLESFFNSHKEISITNPSALKNAVSSAPHPPVKVGLLKERIVIGITADCLKASITYNMAVEELDIKNRDMLTFETGRKLIESGIVFGINTGFLTGKIACGEPYIIAEGIPPVDGTDAIIRTFELQESKPQIHEDGKVDFYELKLINKIKTGEWLGERIEATEGIPGKSVTGEILKPVKGKNLPILYDRNTVTEIFDGKKTVLYARTNGAVNYIDSKVTVSNHLEIDGDIDFKTGNLKFDGYLTIRGAVADGFSVEATKDIEINSELGLGNIKGILSTQGSIFIKGGISSKGKTEIRAAKNIFTKFIDNVVVSCGGTAHIGFYCINSIVNAGEVTFDSPNGRIIGGSVTAEYRIVAPIIGSEIEKKTLVEVKGFNRTFLVTQLDEVFRKISELKNEQQKLKVQLSSCDNIDQLNQYQRKEYSENQSRLINIKDEIKELEEKRKGLAGYLRIRGEGEVTVSKKIYPNCTLRIKGKLVDMSSSALAASYFISEDELKQI